MLLNSLVFGMLIVRIDETLRRNDSTLDMPQCLCLFACVCGDRLWRISMSPKALLLLRPL